MKLVQNIALIMLAFISTSIFAAKIDTPCNSLIGTWSGDAIDDNGKSVHVSLQIDKVTTDTIGVHDKYASFDLTGQQQMGDGDYQPIAYPSLCVVSLPSRSITSVQITAPAGMMFEDFDSAYNPTVMYIHYIYYAGISYHDGYLTKE